MHKLSSHAFPTTSPTPPQPERMTGPATRQVSALSATLARRRLVQQHIWTASQLQRQEEDDWLQSLQADDDAQAQTKPQSRMSATRRRKGVASRSNEAKQAQLQTLGTTQFGRNMLQRKVENFADMVALVTPSQPARQVQNATEASSPQYSKPSRASASDRQSAVAQHRPGRPTSNISSHTGAGIMNTSSSMPSYTQEKMDENATNYTSEVATALSNPHLRRLHDAAAAWKRSQTQQAGHASCSERQQVPKQAAAAWSRPNASPSLSSSQLDTQPRLNKSDRTETAGSFTDVQLHHHAPAHVASDTDSDLQKLEASAVQLRQACHVSSSQVKSTAQIDNGMDTPIDDPAATSVTWQEPQQGHERHDPAALQSLTNGFRHNDTRDLPDPLLDERSRQVANIPPPPPKPAQQPKASWWAAIKGDAPPWLL
ncbi:hypothetical protein WJX77_001624 [Trebouxia sp. C0004]